MIEAQEATSSKSTESRANGSLLGTTLSLATSLILLAGSNFKPSDASRGLAISEPRDNLAWALSSLRWPFGNGKLRRLESGDEIVRGGQNTTMLLLFTQPGSGLEPEAMISRHTSLEDLRRTRFNPKHPTLLLVHGYRGSSLARQFWAAEIKDLALSNGGPMNVLYVDWSHLAVSLIYWQVASLVPEVADDVYHVLVQLKRAFPQLRYEDCQMAGHSLGAHVSGLVSKRLGGRMNRLMALDPAAPLFESAAAREKVSQDDAQFVVAYHTTKILGTDMLVADADVFFNNATSQPSCEASLLTNLVPGLCPHRQAGFYAGAYFGHCPLVGVSCPDYARFVAGECGFCPREQPDTPPCALALGYDWQYDTKLRSHHKKPAKWPKQPKGSTDVEWQPRGGRKSGVYHVATSAAYPYCAFLYQVVVRFPERLLTEMAAIESSGFIMDLASKGSPEVARIRIVNRLRPDSALEVYDHPSSGGFLRRSSARSVQISGRYVYSTLVAVGNENQALFKAMPMKFDRARLLAPGQLLSLEANELPEVWVNYMSSSEFDIRASHSGPIGNITVRRAPSRRSDQLETRHSSRMRPRV